MRELAAANYFGGMTSYPSMQEPMRPIEKLGFLAFGILVLLAFSFLQPADRQSIDDSAPTTTEGKIRAAISRQYYCPWLREYKSAGSDQTGTVYFADCNDSDKLYMVFFDPTGAAKVTPLPVGKVRR